jgi:signal transduction histidine kinase/CheY-like chemotaxis protein
MPPTDQRMREKIDLVASSCREVFASLSALLGCPITLSSIADGSVLVQAGPQPFCDKYHLRHPQSATMCRDARRQLEQALAQGRTGLVPCLCAHHLAQAAIPLVVDGRVVAGVFLGQVLLQPPDPDDLRRSAEALGWDAEAYVRDAMELPVMTRERFDEVVAAVARITRAVAAKVESRQQAEEALRAKAALLSTINNEVRNPLNGIIGLANLLMETGLDHEQRELTLVLRDSSDSLLRLLNNILDFSRIESGKVALERAEFPVHKVCHSAVSLLALQAEKKGLSLAFYIAPDVPPMFRGDAGRVRQILLNLLGNALKFTERGEVELSVSCGTEPTGRPVLQLRVRDTGIGVPPEHRERLFEPYEQSDPAVQGKYGGAGLGLTICRRLLDLMDGTIAMHSAPGAGCTVTVSLPLPVAPEPRQEPGPLAGRTIHLIESGRGSTAAIRQSIEDAGGAVRIFQGVRATSAGSEDTEPPDAILLDGHVPSAQLARVVERWSDALPRPRFVLLLPAESDARSSRIPGCDAIVSMPPDPVELVSLLAGSGEPLASSWVADAGFAATNPLRILVAEDDPSNQILMLTCLRQMGYHPDLASDGAETVQAVTERDYDVVFMDLNLPALNGFDAARAIHALDGAKARTHMVAVTAYVGPDTDDQCREVGFDGFLAKPFHPADLAACLARVRPARRRSAA